MDSTKRDSAGGITIALRSDPDINTDAMNTIGSTHYGAGTYTHGINSQQKLNALKNAQTSEVSSVNDGAGGAATTLPQSVIERDSEEHEIGHMLTYQRESTTLDQRVNVNDTVGLHTSRMTNPGPPQVTNPQNVLMQINKYVHPCERLPQFLKQTDLNEFAKDYTARENERIKDHLQAFDEMLT